MSETGKGVKELFEEVIHRGLCTGCGACLERCPYELPIPDLIRENIEWVEDQL